MNWKALYKQCEVNQEAYPGYHFAPKPTEAALRAFEQAHNLLLPKSYRDFAIVFGPGELAGLYRLATPLTLSNDYELTKFSQNLHGDADERLLEGFGSADETGRFLFFSDGGGCFYGWKLDEMADPASREYAIYEFDFPPMKRVATTFQEFVTEYILKPSVVRGWTPEKRFSPLQIEG
jgi:hypothetical protein